MSVSYLLTPFYIYKMLNSLRRSCLLFLAVCFSSHYSFAQLDSKAVDLGLSVEWASQNIGAYTENDYGWYLAWGEMREKTEYSFDSYKFTEADGSQNMIFLGRNISGTQYDVARYLWKGEWRLPTYEEVHDLIRLCNWKWVCQGDTYGFRVTGRNGNSIFLPAAGTDDKKSKNTECLFWTGEMCPGFGRSAYAFQGNVDNATGKLAGDIKGYYRSIGLSVRPVRDNRNYKPKFIPTNDQMRAWADPKYERVINAYLDEDEKKLYEALCILSIKGDAMAQCATAALLIYGSGVKRDYAAAKELLASSAKSGYKRAEYLLGAFGSLNRYRKGEVVKLWGLDPKAYLEQVGEDPFWRSCFMTKRLDDSNGIDVFRWFFVPDGGWGYRDIMYYAALVFLDKESPLYNQSVGMRWLKKSADLEYPDAEQLLIEFLSKIK